MLGMKGNKLDCYSEGRKARRLWSSLWSCLYDIRSGEDPPTMPCSLPFQPPPAGWLPQARVVTGMVSLPSVKCWPENTPPTFTSVSRSGFQEVWSSGTQRNLEICHEEDGNPRSKVDPRLNKAVWAKGIRNVPYHIHAMFSRQPNEDEKSPNKLY